MANKVTQEDILRINEIYYKVHTYAETARQTGFSAGTVKKYVIPGWRPVDAAQIKKFDLNDLPDFDATSFEGVENYGDLCVLNEKEVEEIHALWEGLAV